MKHSIIFKVGNNIIYQYAPEPKPLAANSISPVEFNRSLPEWEQTSKSYIIKETDIAGFGDLITPNSLVSEIQVPYDNVEVYVDGLKNYARFSGNPDRSLDSSRSTSVAQKQLPPPPVVPITQVPKGMVVIFEIDEVGEPKMVIANNSSSLLIEQKLFLSFIIKAIRDGLELIKTENGGCEITIKSK